MADGKFDIEKLPPVTPIDIVARETGGLRPSYPGSYGYGYNYGQAEQKIHLRELWRTVRKRKWLILTITFVVTTLVTIDMYRTKNTYQASTLVEIGKDTNRLGMPGSVFGDDYDPFYMINMKTKQLMIKSRSLLESVVINKKLDQNPRFLQASGKKSVWEALKLMGAKVGIADKNKDSDEAQTDSAIIPLTPAGDIRTRTDEEKEMLERAIGILDGGLSSDPVKETRALRISFTHADPEVAAEVANAVASAFLSRNFENKTQKFTDAAKWLDETTRKLKAKAEEAEKKLADYTRDHGIFATGDKDGTLTTMKLSRLHEEVLRAESDRMIKQSLFDEVKQGRVQKNPEAYADLLFKTSPKLVELQKQLGDLETQSAELSNRYGPDNPKVKEVDLKIAAINQQLRDSRTSLEEKLKTEYERAVRVENDLKKSLAEAKGEATQQNQDSIQYNILKEEVNSNNKLYQDFLQKTNQAEAQKVEQQNNLLIIEEAQKGLPVGPRRMFTILIGFMLSTAAGVGLAFFLEYLDNTIKTVEDVTRYAQLPALSVIPATGSSTHRRMSAKGKKAIGAVAGVSNLPVKSEQLVSLDTRSSAAEAYRVLRTSVLLSAAGQPPKSILITSGQPGEGKTTTAINTAISLSQLGASVLIIDCDLRRPTTHKVLGVDHIQGLSTYLSRNNVALDEVIQKLSIANLSLLPCGPIPPNPAELIISEKMKEMLRELADRYDHIIIDSPPLINVTDPVILSTMVDGVILVVHGGKSTRDIVRRARQELSAVGAKIFGVVLNNVDLRREGYDNYYYARYYSGYAQDTVQDGAEASSQ